MTASATPENYTTLTDVTESPRRHPNSGRLRIPSEELHGDALRHRVERSILDPIDPAEHRSLH